MPTNWLDSSGARGRGAILPERIYAKVSAFFHLLQGGRWTYRLVRSLAPIAGVREGGNHMRRSHVTAAMVGIVLGMLGIIRDHGVAA